MIFYTRRFVNIQARVECRFQDSQHPPKDYLFASFAIHENSGSPYPRYFETPPLDNYNYREDYQGCKVDKNTSQALWRF